MKIKKTYVLRNVADNWLVIPFGKDSVDFSVMIFLNEAGVLLWNRLEQGAEFEDLVSVLTGEYVVSPEEALADAKAFCEKLAKAGCFEE